MIALLASAAVPSRATTVAARLAELGPARARLAERFAAAEVTYPPTAVTLVALKAEEVLEVHVKTPEGSWPIATTYPILALGPFPGPKLRQGDCRTPEGLYRLTLLNPDSKYHLSVMIDYPNAEDRAQAALEGRDDLGGDIVIHGHKISAGCLAMGDDAIEELFVLIADVGLLACDLVIAPRDLRRDPVGPGDDHLPAWLRERYGRIGARLGALR